MPMSVDEVAYRFDDLVAAIERIAAASERLAASWELLSRTYATEVEHDVDVADGGDG